MKTLPELYSWQQEGFPHWLQDSPSLLGKVSGETSPGPCWCSHRSFLHGRAGHLSALTASLQFSEQSCDMFCGISGDLLSCRKSWDKKQNFPRTTVRSWLSSLQIFSAAGKNPCFSSFTACLPSHHPHLPSSWQLQSFIAQESNVAKCYLWFNWFLYHLEAQVLFRVIPLPCAHLPPPYQSSCSPMGFSIPSLWISLTAVLSRILASSCPISWGVSYLPPIILIFQRGCPWLQFLNNFWINQRMLRLLCMQSDP